MDWLEGKGWAMKVEEKQRNGKGMTMQGQDRKLHDWKGNEIT